MVAFLNGFGWSGIIFNAVVTAFHKTKTENENNGEAVVISRLYPTKTNYWCSDMKSTLRA